MSIADLNVDEFVQEMLDTIVEPRGPMIGLATGDDAIPGPEELTWLEPPTFKSTGQTLPDPIPEGHYLAYRFQYRRGVVLDRWVPDNRDDPEDPIGPEVRKSFQGWLAGLRDEVRRFLLIAAYPGGSSRGSPTGMWPGRVS